MKYKSPIVIAALITFYIWIDQYGNTCMWWVPDGTINFSITPPPRPTPYPVIVHPNIQPAATPRPGTGRPPAI